MTYDNGERSYSRREFLGMLSKVALATALSGTAGNLLAACVNAPTETKCDYRIKQVKSGAISPAQYVDSVSGCMKEVVAARKGGKLKQVLYHPDENELRSLIGDLFDKSEPDVETAYAVKDAIEIYRYNLSRGNARATQFPTYRKFLGHEIPSVIVFMPRFMELESDEEFRFVVRHELKHVGDWYDGINLGGIHIQGNDPAISNQLLGSLGELRAYYEELSGIFQMQAKTGTLPVGRNFFKDEIMQYHRNKESAKNDSITNREKLITELQLQQFEGIRTKELGRHEARRMIGEEADRWNKFIGADFNLFGKKQSVLAYE